MESIIRPSMPVNNRTQQCRWHGYSSTAALEQAAAQTIAHTAQQSIETRNAFHLVLAGGSTPRRVYELLRTLVTDWRRWHIYYGDERCLPTDHAERNSQMANLAWLKHVGIPPEQIHAMPAELGAETAALAYADVVGGLPLFDLCLLGLGEDGHTASLFPGHEWGISNEAPATLPVHHAPKPPADRVSLSARRLSLSRHVLFLVSGSSKKQAVLDWRSGVSIPAAAITPTEGVDVYLDEDLLQTSSSA